MISTPRRTVLVRASFVNSEEVSLSKYVFASETSCTRLLHRIGGARIREECVERGELFAFEFPRARRRVQRGVKR